MTAWTHHGGRLGDARAAWPDAPTPWLDLSTGINPHAWPGADDMAIDWRALPDARALAALEAAAATYFGAEPAHVCALPGSEIGLRLIGDLLPGPAAHVTPTYRTHAEMFGGTRPIALDGIADAAATVIVANPGNPDGRILSSDQLPDALPAPHWLVVDEAFADTVPAISLAGTVRDDRRLAIFRSFGKMFGLAGVRLGFVIAPRPLIAAFRTRLGDWPVSAAAVAIGTAAYQDAGWIADMRGRLHAEAAALDTMLAHHGLIGTGGCPLFRLIDTPDAAALFDRLARYGILTRPFDYAPHWLRIGLPGSDEALARLSGALRDG